MPHSDQNRSAAKDSWDLWVDTGGTFTDCIATDPRGRVHRAKVLSSSALRGFIEETLDAKTLVISGKWRLPSDFLKGFRFHLLGIEHAVTRVTSYAADDSLLRLERPISSSMKPGTPFEVCSPEEAPVLAARMVTGTLPGEPLPSMNVRLATTRGTNALLEKKGTEVAFFVTRGFGDLLVIGNQQRPDLFALDIRKPEPLYARVVEVEERLDASGNVLRALDPSALAARADALVNAGVRTAAVALLHSYVNDAHESRLAEFLLGRGFLHVSRSSDLAPFIRILPRAETAVVNAYLSTVIDDYLRNVREPIPGGSIHVMTSAGGLVHSGAYRAKDSLLSGPAGGVVGAVLAGKRSGFEKIIAFDMGGTSTDVARYDGEYDYTFEHVVGDAHLVAPALAVESVAAGGGSVCAYEGLELRVGPESAGADPGPACYGAGGPLTLTDVNLLLGRLDPAWFEIPIDRAASERALDGILERIAGHHGGAVNPEEILEGFLAIADERMADAIRKISVRKGYDPEAYALVAFGGAGAQHACAVAERLGMRSIVVPRDASLLSALGLGHAVIERFAHRQVLMPLASVGENIPEIIRELEEEAIRSLREEGVGAYEIRRRFVHMRFEGQDATVPVEFTIVDRLMEYFQDAYRSLYGHWPEERGVEVESIRIVASSEAAEAYEARTGAGKAVSPEEHGALRGIPVFYRANLRPGFECRGPALVFEDLSTTVVAPGWSCRVDDCGSLLLERSEAWRPEEDARSEIVARELFTHRFTAIVEEMGERLRRTALSTNIKERLDFSCALLDARGELIVNAPHIPVHLGSMGLCVRSVRAVLPMEPGDVVLTNHPAFGGSHLPDITVITPAYTEEGALIGYVANRAHHAELGGIRPGSMPAMAASLAEEGVLLPPMHLLRGDEPRWEAIRRVLRESPHPSRAVEENLIDLQASVAANARGVRLLRSLAETHGLETVHRFMDALKQRAERKIRNALSAIPDGTYDAVETLDDGSPIRVSVAIHGEEATVDFEGTAGVHPGNLNATPAIVHSAVIYVLRLLIDEPLPLNEGLLAPVTIRIPAGMLHPPFPEDASRAPSIVGGNVETSQRLVDTLLKALGLCACSQGTMNNLLFGSEDFSYYETVCGGCGAGESFDGASAVHSHMTNTRITDPEVIERRTPVRIERFAVRGRSGGKGKHTGGDGAIREIAFLRPLSLSVLGQHRAQGPYGIHGGGPGRPAVQRLIRKNGNEERLESSDGREVNPGDRLILETPGGGGYGKKV